MWRPIEFRGSPGLPARMPHICEEYSYRDKQDHFAEIVLLRNRSFPRCSRLCRFQQGNGFCTHKGLFREASRLIACHCSASYASRAQEKHPPSSSTFALAHLHSQMAWMPLAPLPQVQLNLSSWNWWRARRKNYIGKKSLKKPAIKPFRMRSSFLRVLQQKLAPRQTNAEEKINAGRIPSSI